MPKNTVIKPTFSVQTRLVLVADVEVEAEADTLEEAIEIGKTWTMKDIVKLDPAASECDSKLRVVGAFSQASWGTD